MGDSTRLTRGFLLVIVVLVIAVSGVGLVYLSSGLSGSGQDSGGASANVNDGSTTERPDTPRQTTELPRQTTAAQRQTTAGEQSTPSEPSTTPTTTEAGPEVLRFSVTYDDSAPREHTELVRDTLSFWDEQTDARIRLVSNPAESDFTIRFTGLITVCDDETTETTFYYCFRDAATTQNRTIAVSGVFTRSYTKEILRNAVGWAAGYDNPEHQSGVISLDERHGRYIDPWPLQSEVVVNLSVHANESRDWASLVRTGIDYWNEHDDEYGNYTESLKFRPNASDVDVTVHIRDEIPVCGIHDSDTYLGCAEILNKSILADGNETVEIVNGYTDRTTIDTVKHEFGHLFGITHGEPPMPIMNETDADARLLPRPNVSQRLKPFKNTTIHVFVHYESFSAPEHDVREQVEHAVEYYDGGADGNVPRSLDVLLTRNRSAAEIVIREGDVSPCSGTRDEGSCGINYGIHTDDDPALEYYTQQNISIKGIETDALGWHVGYWMGFSIGNADSVEDLPAVFRDADYDDRREWWRRV